MPVRRINYDISEFTIGFSRTINLGNFESARVEASVTMTLPDHQDEGGHDFGLAKQDAQVELRRLLEETYRHQYTDRKKIA